LQSFIIRKNRENLTNKYTNFTQQLGECNIETTNGSLTICHNQTKELDCGENRIIHIEEGTNYGHLDADTCTESTTTAANSPVGGNAATTTTELTAAADATTTTELAAAAADTTTTISSIDTTTVAPGAALETTTTVSAAVLTTGSAVGSNAYVQCKVDNSKEKVEEL
jgi:hypothetical protein